jgi:DNA polymerase I-like protein with 3'-5' exonuclease and polymerase domains
MVLVGADASGLELRCLAHYLGLFDGGAYSIVVCDGDVHTTNQIAFGLPPGKENRPFSKNGIYCLIYGGGDKKLGITIFPPDKFGAKTDEEYEDLGRKARSKFARKIMGYAALVALVKGKAKERGWIKGLDGRRLHVRSQHAALNTLLQSAGALLVKKATVLWYRNCLAAGLVWGRDFALVAHIHDEIQAEARPEHAQFVGQAFVDAIRQTGLEWKFRCPLSGEFKVGDSWVATH